MANKTAADNQMPLVSSETLPTVNDMPEETAAPRTVRYADRETVRRVGKEIFRRHARLFRELAK